MKYRLLAIAICSVATISAGAVANERPHVVIFIADDLGFSDLGCYGGEIATPHLDSLAAQGLRFTQFYNTGRCWPTRASLLTGFYAQQVRRDSLPGIPRSARGKRPTWARLLPDMLRPAGYRSYHSGKWHVDGMPVESGFDRSYYLRDQGRFFNPRVHWEDDQKLPPVDADSGFYGTIAIADHAIKYLKEHAEQHAASPFFLYAAFTAPHFPLHALQEDIDRYRQRYNRDWEDLRRERWHRQRCLELIGTEPHRLSKVERDIGPPYDFPEHLKILGPGEVNRPIPWDDLTATQQNFQATKMAIHAAMIDRMDREVGRILDQLRAMHALQNTLIFFLSDNGASAEIMVRDDGHDPTAAAGSAKTYLCLGPGWSTTCNTPFRRHKTWTHEGGICTPLIVHWPNGFSARGELRRVPGHVIDLVPTILEATGAPRLTEWHEAEVPPGPGTSLIPVLLHGDSVNREYLWWSHESNRAIRVGDWKIVAAGQDAPWELYNLAQDRAETNDLSKTHPDRVRQLAVQWKQRRDEFQVLATSDLEDDEPLQPPAETGRQECPQGDSGNSDPQAQERAPGER